MQKLSSKKIFYVLLSGLLLLCTPSLWAFDFKQCQQVFLKGKSIDDYISIEMQLPEQQRSIKYITRLKSLKKSKDCSKLLSFASLKENGMLIDRSRLASDLLESFNEFHYHWLMPKDLDRSKSCVDQYQWDIYDPKAPAYHLTRALFQKSRKASEVLTSYGESRIVRKGEDPTISSKTQHRGEEYKAALKLQKNVTFVGEGEILGFLLKHATDSSQFYLPQGKRNRWKKKMPFQSEHNIYQHFGAGILGSPSYLYYHLKEQAFFESDGTRKLTRNLANAIFENFLCSTPDKFNDPAKLKEYLHTFTPQHGSDNPTHQPTLWNHPITHESNCLECHYPLDQMAAGFRNLTLIPSAPKCNDSNIQILYPVFLKSDHRQQIWTQVEKEKSETIPQDFSASYGVGYFNTKRFKTLRQLGNLISEDIHFYSCQVKRYYQWIHHSYPNSNIVDKLAKSYINHQDGFTLINEIINQGPYLQDFSSSKKNKTR